MASSKIKDVRAYLETLAPSSYQESYDNSRLLTGNPETVVTGTLVTLDCTEQVVEEAIALRCNLVVAHHPILFKPLKTLSGNSYVERTLIKAVKNDVAIYAIHTNLDNVLGGVNGRIAARIGIVKPTILAPAQGTLSKLVTFVPEKNKEALLQALYAAGCGQIGNYNDCSFQVPGKGTFMPGTGSNPHIGSKGKREVVEEVRVEAIFPSHRQSVVIDSMRSAHPYEEVAYYVTPLSNENQEVGAGLIGDLAKPEEPMAFLQRLKSVMATALIRHTALPDKLLRRVAVCGGAGSFLLQQSISKGADAFVSADFKYHEFFDADSRILIADVGHFESEQFTRELILEVLTEKFTTFASHFSKTATNPVKYI